MSNVVLQGFDDEGAQYITQGYTPGKPPKPKPPPSIPGGPKFFNLQNISQQNITILYEPTFILPPGDIVTVESALTELGQLRNLQELNQITVYPRVI